MVLSNNTLNTGKYSMQIIDVSMPISNNTHSYRPSWKNDISEIMSTSNGDPSTVYRLNLCSHTGTYIETSQHKLANNIVLDNFPLDRFYCEVNIVKVEANKSNEITLMNFLNYLENNQMLLDESSSLIIFCGWGKSNFGSTNFITKAPYFSKELTEHLANLKLRLLAVDTPVIDKQEAPYDAVKLLFEENNDLLLLAPLYIDETKLLGKKYILNCMPLKIENISATLCRPVLIGNEFL